jgi:WD40 repeat protein
MFLLFCSWDVQSGEMVGQLAGHTATVRDVHWHPDQPTLMTSSWDCSVMQWSYHPDGPFAPRRRELRVRRTGV